MRKDTFIREYTVYAIRTEEEYEVLKKELKHKVLDKTLFEDNYEIFSRILYSRERKTTPAIRVGGKGLQYYDVGRSSFEWYKYQNAGFFKIKNFVEMSDILEQLKIKEKEEKEKKQKMEEEGIRICAVCGEVIGEGEDYLENRHGEYLCEKCQDDGYLICEDCGEFTDEPYSIDDGYKYVCRECCGDYYYCENCEEYFSRSNVYDTYNDGYVCICCADNHYYRCQDCGNYVHESDACWNDRREEYYCPHCYEDNCEYDGCVECYHAHKYNTIKFYQDDNDYTVDYDNYAGGYGFELEVDEGDDRGECSDELQNLLGDHAYYETDGSLSDEYGFEIITQPHTRLAMEQLPFKKMVKILRKYGYKSHDAQCCGFHIHASRKLFGDTENERTENIAKMILFYERYWDDLVKVSRRKAFGYCYKMSERGGYNGNEGDIDDERAKSIAKGEDDIAKNRYKSINLTNSNTIEFRLMRGTLNLNTIRATLDFTMTLVENCKNVPMSEIDNKDLWLKGLKDETIEYLKTRRAFGYEPDDEEDE